MTDSRSELPFSRWWLVVVAALALGAVGTYQFVWSSIRVSIGAALGTSETGLGTVFTVFLVFQSLSQFPAGWVRDRYGPRVPLLIGTPLLVAGYVWTGSASALWEVLVAYSLGGIGSGVVYTVAVNTPVKWFTDRRGLATGAVMTAYSGVSFLLIPVVREGVRTALGQTLTLLGVGVGAAALLGAVVLTDPSEESDSADSRSTEPDDSTGYGWRETIQTWQFWLLYVVFVVINGAGLMLIGKVVAYAEVLALPAAVATVSASVVAFADSLGMAVIGALSDRFGRVRTVGVSLVLSGIALAGAAVAGAGAAAWLFAALAGSAALFRSPAFAIFPSLVGDYYGQAYSSENYALLYTGKVWGSVLGGTVASVLVVSLGWTTSFLLAAGALVVAGVLTLPLRPPAPADSAETTTASAD